ncbi:MAG: sulfate transporter family protein, partial [Pseudomonadota bacterium]
DPSIFVLCLVGVGVFASICILDVSRNNSARHLARSKYLISALPLLFFGVWLGLQSLVSAYLLPFIDGWVWLTSIVLWVLGAGVVIAGGFLLGPVTALFAGIFLDEIAEHVEQHHYAQDPPGKAMPLAPSILTAVKFGILVLFANLIALLLVWLAGFGVIIFFIVNGYLLGREYFQFAAQRFHSEKDVNQLCRKFGLEVFLCGLIIAAFMSVPLLNFLTPVFAAIMMVHLYKAVSSRQPELSAR